MRLPPTLMRAMQRGVGGWSFWCVDLEALIPAWHLTRMIPHIVCEALVSMDAKFRVPYADFSRARTPPDQLIRLTSNEVLA